MYRDEITDQDILNECRTFRDSLRMSWRRSGKTIEQISISLLGPACTLQEVTNKVKNLSRIINPRSPEDKRNLDGEEMIPYMIATGNSIPLRWLNLKFNPEQRHTVTNEDLSLQINSLESLFRGTMRDIYVASHRSRMAGLKNGRLSLTQDSVPIWLMLDAEIISTTGDCING